MACSIGDGTSEITVAREIHSIGNEFATDYYEAFTAAPGCPLSERFYDDKSKYVFLQLGRAPDFMARGADQIGRFRVRMGYHECTLTVISVDTIEVKANWLAVLAVGELMRPGEGHQPSRKFVQSTVVRYAPSPLAKRFVVIGTVFMFDDRIVDNNVFAPDSEYLSVRQIVDHPTDNDNADNLDNNNNIYTPDRLETIEKRSKETQATASIKKKAAIETQNDDGKKKDDIVKIREKTETVKETSNKSSEKSIDNDNKQVSTTVIIPDQLNINKKLPSVKQLAQLKDPRPKESMKTLIDETKTVSDGALTTVEVSKTKRKSSKKKKSTVAEERPTRAIDKSNDPNEHDDESVKDASKDPTRKKKGPVNDDSPIVPVVELYVGKLSKLIETNQLKETFCKFGKVVSTNIFEVPKKKGQLERRRYGIVRYENSDTVAVVARLGTVVLGNGDKVIVEKSVKKTQSQAKSL